jgi:hypothetical protein
MPILFLILGGGLVFYFATHKAAPSTSGSSNSFVCPEGVPNKASKDLTDAENKKLTDAIQVWAKSPDNSPSIPAAQRIGMMADAFDRCGLTIIAGETRSMASDPQSVALLQQLSDAAAAQQKASGGAAVGGMASLAYRQGYARGFQDGARRLRVAVAVPTHEFGFGYHHGYAAAVTRR